MHFVTSPAPLYDPTTGLPRARALHAALSSCDQFNLVVVEVVSPLSDVALRSARDVLLRTANGRASVYRIGAAQFGVLIASSIAQGPALFIQALGTELARENQRASSSLMLLCGEASARGARDPRDVVRLATGAIARQKHATAVTPASGVSALELVSVAEAI